MAPSSSKNGTVIPAKAGTSMRSRNAEQGLFLRLW